ncbi:hypothetical protein CEXT_372861 [Caerostris extrusa]|uniref:Uncharacterized protein n=1 Tax=Caerostris extrusa TaxID=172846 RepID=A0AAV4NEC3_CAEEX|nr:hypothetical protein CEXT_372861 [Caerostris extrusa]
MARKTVPKHSGSIPTHIRELDLPPIPTFNCHPYKKTTSLLRKRKGIVLESSPNKPAIVREGGCRGKTHELAWLAGNGAFLRRKARHGERCQSSERDRCTHTDSHLICR